MEPQEFIFKFIRDKTLFLIVVFSFSLISIYLLKDGNECYMTNCVITTAKEYWTDQPVCVLALLSNHQIAKKINYGYCLDKKDEHLKCNWNSFLEEPTIECDRLVYLFFESTAIISFLPLCYSLYLKWYYRNERKLVVKID